MKRQLVKESPQSKIKRKVAAAPAPVEDDDERFWREEIAGFENVSFNSMDEAISAIASAVALKMSAGDADEDEIEFVRTLLLENPQVVRWIEEKISKGKP